MTAKEDSGPPSLLSVVHEYGPLQAALVAALSTQAARQLHVTDLFSWPKSGSVEVAAVRWNFKRHGYGYEFTDPISGRVVDAHDHLDAEVCPIDAWRLELYCESKGVGAVSVDGQIFSTGDHSRISAALERLVALGAIRPFRMSSAGVALNYLPVDAPWL